MLVEQNEFRLYDVGRNRTAGRREREREREGAEGWERLSEKVREIGWKRRKWEGEKELLKNGKK